MKRVCTNCKKHLPINTEHYEIHYMPYCTDCIEVKPYTAYVYYIDGEFVGDSESGDAEHVKSYEDLYEEEEETK